MATPTVYVICDQNCKFEGMTKEQIYAAIMQAVNEGTIGDIDAGFITTVKTINDVSIKFFYGTQAAYNELTEEQKENLVASITDDTTTDDLYNSIQILSESVDEALKESDDAVETSNAASETAAAAIQTADAASETAAAASQTATEASETAAAAAEAVNSKADTNGNYPEMSVGNATNADNATTADSATNATNDSEGNNIVETYAKKAELPQAPVLYLHNIMLDGQCISDSTYTYNCFCSLQIFNDYPDRMNFDEVLSSLVDESTEPMEIMASGYLALNTSRYIVQSVHTEGENICVTAAGTARYISSETITMRDYVKRIL